MGVPVSRHAATKTKHVAVHGNPVVVDSDGESSKNNQGSPFEYSIWEHLPAVVLVEVFKFLPNRDKVNAALTCRAWNETYTRPEIWRCARFTFKFNGIDDVRNLTCPAKLTKSICHLTVCCQCADSFSYRIKGHGTGKLFSFIKRLQKHKVFKLLSLKIIINDHEQDHWLSTETFLILRKFISTQKRLENLELTRTELDNGNGFDLLRSISTSCGSTMATISIDGFFRLAVSVGRDRLWTNFTSLTDLTISQKYLSDLLLTTLSETGSLTRLVVLSNCVFTVTQGTSTGAWEKLKLSCPSLEARYCFNEESSRAFEMCEMLVPGTPLVGLEFKWSDSRDVWKYLARHITYHFQNTLITLVIIIGSELLRADSLLNKIVKRCVQLKELNFTDRLDDSTFQKELLEDIQKDLDIATASRLRFIYNEEEIELTPTG